MAVRSKNSEEVTKEKFNNLPKLKLCLTLGKPVELGIGIGNGWFDLHRGSIYTFFNINSLSIQVFEHTITEHTDIWTNITLTYTVLKKP